jgi:hypothetical protein
MNFYPNPSGIHRRNLFSSPLLSKRLTKNPLFEVISLRGATGPLLYQFSLEGFYDTRTEDILEGQHAVELAMFKERLKFVIDNMDSITKNPNVSIADRIKSESVKLEALAILRDAIKGSISCPDPHSVLE